jgi:hypothetical protein
LFRIFADGKKLAVSMKFTRFADQQAATIFSSILLYDVGEEVIV